MLWGTLNIRLGTARRISLRKRNYYKQLRITLIWIGYTVLPKKKLIRYNQYQKGISPY
ncbi:hypothetical protein ACFFF5_18070 [Lederbergia wuyishanensis]|uniref:Uncharacterized protein n=1 Tax=Lederbergia wuyishanensis TaxID=1347903 RepID=A0ABU0D4M8_9BACI|nr:hypothetical protein [Lederbergia wuyishanensis]MCJ8008066.1 hypothetical protein [Lederbergia wuyishanensis]MDQ0343349.1 hypothetical protein [Lederbergia wuyishanensis]